MKLRICLLSLLMMLSLSACSGKKENQPAEKFVMPEQIVEIPEASPTPGLSLTFIIEGTAETVPAYKYEGMDYTLVVPDGGWHMHEPGAWQATFNQNVRFWVKGYSGETMASLVEQLSLSGYVARIEDRLMMRMDGESGLIENVMLFKNGDTLKAVFYNYPEDVAEGFGVRLSTIVNTFSWKDPAPDATYGSQVGLSTSDAMSAEDLPDAPGAEENIATAQSAAANQIAVLISSTETRARELEERMMHGDADTGAASALYSLWDDTLNAVWKILKANMSEADFDVLLNEQIAWIGQKDAAGSDNAAQMTKDRVYVLQSYLE